MSTFSAMSEQLPEPVKQLLRKKFENLSRSIYNRRHVINQQLIDMHLEDIFFCVSPDQQTKLKEAVLLLKSSLELVVTYAYNNDTEQVAFCPMICGTNRKTEKTSFVFGNGVAYEDVHDFFNKCKVAEAAWFVFYEEKNHFAPCGKEPMFRYISASEQVTRQCWDLFYMRNFPAKATKIVNSLKPHNTKDFKIISISNDQTKITVEIAKRSVWKTYDVSIESVYAHLSGNAQSKRYNAAVTWNSDHCDDIIRGVKLDGRILKNETNNADAEKVFKKIKVITSQQYIDWSMVFEVVINATVNMNYTQDHVYEAMFVHVLSQYRAFIKHDLSRQFRAVTYPSLDDLDERLTDIQSDLQEIQSELDGERRRSLDDYRRKVSDLEHEPEEYGDGLIACRFVDIRCQTHALLSLIESGSPPTLEIYNSLFVFVKTVICANETLKEPSYADWFPCTVIDGHRRRCYFNEAKTFCFFVRAKVVNGMCTCVLLETIEKTSTTVETEQDVLYRFTITPQATAERLLSSMKRKCEVISKCWAPRLQNIHKIVKMSDCINPRQQGIGDIWTKLLQLFKEGKVFYVIEHDAVHHTLKRTDERIFDAEDDKDVTVIAQQFFEETLQSLKQWESAIGVEKSLHLDALNGNTNVVANMKSHIKSKKTVVNCGGYIPALKTSFKPDLSKTPHRQTRSRKNHSVPAAPMAEAQSKKDKVLLGLVDKFFYYRCHYPTYVIDESRHDFESNIDFKQSLLCVITKHVIANTVEFLEHLHSAQHYIGTSWNVVVFANQNSYDNSTFHKDQTHFLNYKTKNLLIYSCKYLFVDHALLIGVFKTMIQSFGLPLFSGYENCQNLSDYIIQNGPSGVNVNINTIKLFCEYSEAQGLYWHVFVEPSVFELCKHKCYFYNSHFLLASVFSLPYT